MRRASSEDEVRGLPCRTVKLAVGETCFYVNEAGTLLTLDSVAPILAMVDLMEIGCRVTWTSSEGCKVWHPRIGWLPVRMADGCPEVDRGLGLELIKEAEGVKKSRAEAEVYVRELRAHVGDMDFWEQGKKVVDSLPNSTDEAYKWLARMFFQAPSWLLAAIPVKSGMDGPRVPWNRREKQASSLAIHHFVVKIDVSGRRRTTRVT